MSLSSALKVCDSDALGNPCAAATCTSECRQYCGSRPSSCTSSRCHHTQYSKVNCFASGERMNSCVLDKMPSFFSCSLSGEAARSCANRASCNEEMQGCM